MSTLSNLTYPHLCSASFQDLSPSVHWAQEHHNQSIPISRRIYDFELLYIQQGEVHCLFENQQQPLRLGIGQILLIPAGVQHQVYVLKGESANLLGVHFDFFDELAIAKDEDIIVKEETVVLANFCKLPYLEAWGGALPVHFSSTSPQMISLMETVIHEFSQKRLGYELICKGTMLSIIALLYRGLLHSWEPIPNAYSAKLQHIFQEIELDCAAEWSNPKLGQMLNVHEDYMARLFKNGVGMSPSKYVQWIRHQKAKHLLRESEEKVSIIGKTVGYEDTAYFCRVFKKWEYMSPEQYRKCSRIL